MPRLSRASLPPLLALLLLAGCRHPGAALERHAETLAAEIAEQRTRMAAAVPMTLPWPEAVVRLREHNLELQQQHAAVAAAEERRRQVVRDLMPGAAITGNLTKSLGELGRLDGDDTAVALHAFFNIPGLLQWRMRHYAAELEVIRARWALELKERELTVRLRELFLRSALLEQRRTNLTRAGAWQPAGNVAGGLLDATPPALEREAVLWSLRREADELQAAAGKLLGEAAGRWELQAGALPAFDYATRPPGWPQAEHFGRLHRRLQAAELEAMRLREQGVRLQYWPDLTLNLGSPPLYQRAGGREGGFSADQIFLALGTSLNLDLRGRVAGQLREARREAALHARLLREQNALLLQQLEQAATALALNERQLRLTELRLDALRSYSGGTHPARARDNLERLLALDQQRAGLLLERARLEALFWILDETQWPPT
jgi:outer membrane protein TolC